MELRTRGMPVAWFGTLGTSGEQLPPSPWFRFCSKSAANLRLQRESRERERSKWSTLRARKGLLLLAGKPEQPPS